MQQDIPQTDQRRLLGLAGEDLALRRLTEAGLRLVERNYRCRLGEIDLVMRDGPTLVFVEVRSARTTYLDSPRQSVNCLKQRHVVRAAAFYLSCRGLTDKVDVRFDVVAIRFRHGIGETEWIQDAFRPKATSFESRFW